MVFQPRSLIRRLSAISCGFLLILCFKEQNKLVTICDRLHNLKHSSTNSYAFTEHGVTMLSSVLNSEKAIEINIQVVRAFVTLRQFALESKELSERLTELEQYFIQHSKENDADIKEINRALTLLMDRTKPNKIGFKTE